MADNGIVDYLSSSAGRVQVFFGVLSLVSVLPVAWRLLARAGRRLARRILGIGRRPRADTNGGAARPSDRVLARPALRCAGVSGEELATRMRLSGRVPLRRRRQRPRRPQFWSKFRLSAVESQTAPKGAFVVSQWHYRPCSEPDAQDKSPLVGDFELEAVVHPNENRRHLRRSLMATSLKGRTRRVVVIASASDLLNPNAPVRHLVIDAAYRTTFDRDSPGRITMRAAAGACDAAETAYSAPAVAQYDAIWLVVPVANHRAPSRHWGLLRERFSVSDAVPQHSDQALEAHKDVEARFRRELRRERWLTVGAWIFFGPVALVVAALSYRLIFGLIDEDARTASPAEAVDTAVLWILSIYTSLYLWASAAAVVHLCWESIVARYWCRKEGQSARPQSGGGAAAIFEALAPRRWHGPRDAPTWHGGTRAGLLYRRIVTRSAAGRRDGH
ncbi:hypothetical protein [Candidatus Poriferisodalis sp.]|uniref:hypothetical protein n=1 Tax=Candidatus Poriferisodalis sp. TaxID=3101277 RepID=UPI003AF4CAE5